MDILCETLFLSQHLLTLLWC